MGFPQLNFSGITEGISRTLASLFSIRFDMPGLPGTEIPLWLIAVLAVIVGLLFQLRKTR